MTNLTEDQFVYLLNAMENAAVQEVPVKHGYGEKRKAVCTYVSDLRTRLAEMEKALRKCVARLEVIPTFPEDRAALAAARAVLIPPAKETKTIAALPANYYGLR